MAERLIVRGAREHNLRDVHLDLPRDALIVFTGLSGSGKSSLAFDTIFAEGQRRYVESLSAYARQFLGQMDKPDVDFIEGLSPAVSIDQKSTSRNPRSTVGTITEVYDYLRLLYARAGRPHCPKCGRPIARQTPQQIVDRLLELNEGTRFQVLAPVVRGRKGEYAELFLDLQTKGFARVRVDGRIYRLADEQIKIDKQKKHTIEVVVDRLTARASAKQRLTDSVETALRLADGLVLIDFVDVAEDDPGRERMFSEHLACLYDDLSFDELEPRSFSFNSPYGACPACTGLGTKKRVDPELVIPDPSLPLSRGRDPAVVHGPQRGVLRPPADGRRRTPRIHVDTPWERLPAAVQAVLLEGLGDEQIHVRYRNRFNRERSYYTNFEGVIAYLDRRHREAESDSARERWEGYLRDIPCPTCRGTRLKPESLAVTMGGRSIAEVAEMSIADSAAFLGSLELTDRETQIAGRVLKEVDARLAFLLDVGLDYLSLDRAAGTLAGGEAQRIRLATQIGSGLVGVLYVLDEPSIGLHQRDNRRLIETLVRLRDLGNTLIVVEHDEDTIRAADWAVDIGPGAGEHGGHVVVSGPVQELLDSEESITGAYLSGRRSIPIPDIRRAPDPSRRLIVHDAREHNLRDVTVGFPLGCFVAVTGVSGSGKSSLVNDILASVLANKLNGAREVPGRHRTVSGLEHLDKVVRVDQSPIGRTPRSNPGHLHRRLRPRSQAVRRDDRGEGARLSAGPVLLQRQGRPLRGVCRRRHDQDRDELPAGRLRAVRGLPRRPVQPRDPRGPLQGQVDRRRARHVDRGGCRVLRRAAVDRPASEDAGRCRASATCGSASRRRPCPGVRRSASSSRRSCRSVRPAARSTCSTSRPPGCISRTSASCSGVLGRLVDQGNSVIVIEHNLDVIKTADWVVDLGPEGGTGGGRVVAEGTPEEVAAVPESHTGRFLRARPR